jgi:hypothetical protein
MALAQVLHTRDTEWKDQLRAIKAESHDSGCRASAFGSAALKIWGGRKRNYLPPALSEQATGTRRRLMSDNELLDIIFDLHVCSVQAVTPAGHAA